MKVRGDSLITATFVVSSMNVLAAVTALVLRIVNKITGLNLSYFSPGCSNAYNNLKYGYTYLSLKVQFIANIGVIVAGLLVAILLFGPCRSPCKAEQSSAPEGEEEK